MMLATTKIEDFDRFLEIFSTKGAEKRKQHGSKGATVFRDPNEDDRVWVFFDWDAYNITPAGMQVVARAADQYKAGGRVRLEVAGYTDLSGSTGYNQRLSERRANAVADALAGLGVQRQHPPVGLLQIGVDPQ